MAWDWANIQAVLMNNMNYYVNGLIAEWGQTTTLLFIGLFLAVMTFLRRSPPCHWVSSPRNARVTSSPV